MVGIVAITHGQMASGLKDATQLIMGPQEKFEVVSLYEAMDLQEFSDTVLNAIEQVNDQGVLVFVDLFGATPFNTVAKVKNELEKLNTNISLITGVNLPMLLEALSTRESKDFEAFANDVLNAGKESIELLPITNSNN